MAKNKKNLNKPNGFDGLSSFGENNDLNLRMFVDSHQESYTSEVGGFQKTLKPSTKGKNSKIVKRRND